ncbi:plexin-A4-like [Sitodiplosis mosellana]|uniref:plexin-A4-like n=1 Tax=Sitodiplosis mosellana TaxID=263140 RepID=UPI0024440E3D|nr:plexin-A4-like [Sitodiplosis mosellana]
MKKLKQVFMFAMIVELILGVCIVKGESVEHTKITHRNSLNTDLNHLAVDRETGNVYVGGRNKLFQLTSDLKNITEAEIGPRNSFDNCNLFDYFSLECQQAKRIDNMNKVLLIDYNIRRLITCNTVPQGACSTRSLQNISLPEENITEFVIAKTENQSTVAFLAPNFSASTPTNAMYVGVSAVLNSYNQIDVPAISTHRLEKNSMFHILSVNINTGTLIQIRPDVPLYTIRYVYGFSSQGFSYFLTTQLKHSSPNDTNEYITKLVRVCQNDPYYYSYTEVPVDCVSEGQSVKYNLVQAAFLGKSGEDLAIDLRINTTDDIHLLSDGGEQAIVSVPLATFEEQVTAIAVTQFNRNTLVLIGTMDGRIKKLSIESGSAKIEKADIKVFENSPINSMQFDVDELSLYVMSKKQVVKVKVYDNCTVFAKCDECVDAKNLYCGWCPHVNRCTLESNCLDENYSSVSWKNYYWHQNGSSIQEICTSPALTPNLTNFIFYPPIVPYDSKSLIKIITKPFINDFSMWYVKVKIVGVKCAANDIILHTVPIECVLRFSKIRQGKILIQQFGKAVISTKNFQIVNPTIDNFEPKYGPISGGTLITITGQHLSAGRKIYAYMGDSHCYIQSNEENRTVCQNTQPKDIRSGKLRMTFDSATREYDGQNFQFGDDPTIISVVSSKLSHGAPRCIPAGGLNIIVHGTSLKIIQKPELYIHYGNRNFYSECNATNNTVMSCISPIIGADNEKLDPDNPTKLEFGFMMDRVMSVRDLSTKGYPKFELYPDPTYDTFPELVKYIENQQQLAITGKNLNLTCEINDVRVMVGEDLCNITSLSRSLLECQPPQLIAKNEFLKVTVQVGRALKFNIGVVSYDVPVNQSLNSSYRQFSL